MSNYIISKRKPNIGDKGFIVGNRFVSIIGKQSNIPKAGLIFRADFMQDNGVFETGESYTNNGCSFLTDDYMNYVYCPNQNCLISNCNNFPQGNSSFTVSCYGKIVSNDYSRYFMLSYGQDSANKACAIEIR